MGLAKEIVRRIANHRELSGCMFARGGNGDDRVVEDAPQKVVDMLEDLVQQFFCIDRNRMWVNFEDNDLKVDFLFL